MKVFLIQSGPLLCYVIFDAIVNNMLIYPLFIFLLIFLMSNLIHVIFIHVMADYEAVTRGINFKEVEVSYKLLKPFQRYVSTIPKYVH